MDRNATVKVFVEWIGWTECVVGFGDQRTELSVSINANSYLTD
jgi:hypothetical protein